MFSLEQHIVFKVTEKDKSKQTMELICTIPLIKLSSIKVQLLNYNEGKLFHDIQQYCIQWHINDSISSPDLLFELRTKSSVISCPQQTLDKYLPDYFKQLQHSGQCKNINYEQFYQDYSNSFINTVNKIDKDHIVGMINVHHDISS